MKILYLDCGMGAAGDMLTASLLELLPDREHFVSEFNSLGIPRVRMELENAITCGISGTRVHILVDEMQEHSHDVYTHGCEAASESSYKHTHGEHCRMGRAEVADIISHLPLPERLIASALEVYSSIAEAESLVHGVSMEQVHFHELGTLDAVADVIAFCMLMDKLSPDRVIASPVHVGSGHVRCAHGILPVPAPATAILLKGIPSYGSDIKGELCTPTAAALLRRFVHDFAAQPMMKVCAIGYGIGSKVFPMANCVRAFLGEGEAEDAGVFEISCNLDDMTGEDIGFVMETLLIEGALDAYTIPINMKKSRPAVMLCCLCNKQDKDKMAKLILKHSTSLGVRVSEVSRITVPRQERTVTTPYGRVRVKLAKGGCKAEYDDVAKIARENSLTLREVRNMVKEQMDRELGD